MQHEAEEGREELRRPSCSGCLQRLLSSQQLLELLSSTNLWFGPTRRGSTKLFRTRTSTFCAEDGLSLSSRLRVRLYKNSRGGCRKTTLCLNLVMLKYAECCYSPVPQWKIFPFGHFRKHSWWRSLEWAGPPRI